MGCCPLRRRAAEPSAEFWEAELLASPAPPAAGSVVEWPPATSSAGLEQELADADSAVEAEYSRLLEEHERVLGLYILARHAGYESDSS